MQGFSTHWYQGCSKTQPLSTGCSVLPVIVGNVSNAKWLRKRSAIDGSSSIMLSQREASWSMQIGAGRRKKPSSSRNDAEVDAQLSPSEAPRTRKIAVQVSEQHFADRPGMRESVVAQAALERFLDRAAYGCFCLRGHRSE